jgi:hypothetical protein
MVFCAGVDFGLLSVLDAKVATRAEVCSFDGFLVAMVYSFAQRALGLLLTKSTNFMARYAFT